MRYTLEQIMDDYGKYKEMCRLLFELVSDDETRIKLEEILYKGCYKDFNICSGIGNKNNPFIERQRRVAMGCLLIRNPDTFDFFVRNKINLFHGTNSNALPLY